MPRRKYTAIEPGMRFGRWVVIKKAASKIRFDGYRVSMWACLCECGTARNVMDSSLKCGISQSCGCLTLQSVTTHGGASSGKSPEYIAWLKMKNRCYDPKCPNFNNYGGRGIRVGDRWLNSFEHFLEDMGRKPSPKHSLDRTDVNGNYEPGNCRWATSVEQSRNRRNNRILEFMGEALPMASWAERLGFPGYVIRLRIKYGWSIERALTTPLRRWPSKK